MQKIIVKHYLEGIAQDTLIRAAKGALYRNAGSYTNYPESLVADILKTNPYYLSGSQRYILEDYVAEVVGGTSHDEEEMISSIYALAAINYD